MVPNLRLKDDVEPLYFQACHGVLSLCTVVWPGVVVMQTKRFCFRPDSEDALLE